MKKISKTNSFNQVEAYKCGSCSCSCSCFCGLTSLPKSTAKSNASSYNSSGTNKRKAKSNN